MKEKGKKVYVAMSGGVDSSVAATLLKRDGYDVYGVFMQGWSNPRFECAWKEERQDAARVAGILGIPFRVLDFSHEYHDKVVLYLIEEYKNGHTPNPDVMCNKEIKFGLFYDWALNQGADFIATGHYVEKKNDEVFIARDTNKDQTYFLWTLTPKIISHCLFPVGIFTKPEIRKLAEEFDLPVANKKDSQGVCFVGQGSMADFLKDHIPPHPGIIQATTGEKIGDHDGLEYYTIGQRHGIGVPGGGGTFYVAEKESKTHTLIVARGEDDPALFKKEIRYKNPNWIKKINFPYECEARIRYREELASCAVYEDKVVFEKPRRAVAPGQSIVFYKNNMLLGGGIII